MSKEGFYLDKGFGEKIPKAPAENVEIHIVENNGALRKFLPILKMYWENKDQKIILTDDDHIWDNDVFEKIISYSNKLDGLISSAGNCYRDKDPNSWRKKWFHGDILTKPRKCHIISTGYACLIQPKYFNENIFKWEQYRKFGVPFDDEFWFNYMIASNDVIRWVVPVSCRRHKLDKGGVDMFRTNPSRNCKANITRAFKDIIIGDVNIWT